MTTYTGNKMLSAMKGQPRRKKAFIGAIIGAAGQLASGIASAVSKKKEARRQAAEQAEDYGNNAANAMTQSLQNQGEIENEYLDKMTLKNGGGMKLNTKSYDRIGLAKKSKFSRGGRKTAADGTEVGDNNTIDVNVKTKKPIYGVDDVSGTISGASGVLNAAMNNSNGSGTQRTIPQMKVNTKTGIQTPDYDTDYLDVDNNGTYDRLNYEMRCGGSRARATGGTKKSTAEKNRDANNEKMKKVGEALTTKSDKVRTRVRRSKKTGKVAISEESFTDDKGWTHVKTTNHETGKSTYSTHNTSRGLAYGFHASTTHAPYGEAEYENAKRNTFGEQKSKPATEEPKKAENPPVKAKPRPKKQQPKSGGNGNGKGDDNTINTPDTSKQLPEVTVVGKDVNKEKRKQDIINKSKLKPNTDVDKSKLQLEGPSRSNTLSEKQQREIQNERRKQREEKGDRSNLVGAIKDDNKRGVRTMLNGDEYDRKTGKLVRTKGSRAGVKKV